MAIEPTQRTTIELAYKDAATGRFIKNSDQRVTQLKKEAAEYAKNYSHMEKTVERLSKAHDRNADATHRMRIRTKGLQAVMWKLQHTIGVLRNALLVFFFVIRPIQRVIQDVTEAARQQELAETKLALALQGSGMATQKQRKDLEKYASELQRTTIYGDEQIINAQAMLATFKMNSEQIKEVTPRVLDMARGVQKLTGSQVDLQDIAKAVAKGLTGNIGSLTKYGVVISDSVKKSKEFNKILEELDKNYKGMSKAQMNYVDQSAQLSNAFGDLRESIGELISKSPVFIATIVLLKEAFQKIEKAIDKSTKAQQTFDDTWVRGISAVLSMGIMAQGVIENMAIGFKNVGDAARIAYLQIQQHNIEKEIKKIEKGITVWNAEEKMAEIDKLEARAVENAKKIIESFNNIESRGLPDLEKAFDRMQGAYDELIIKSMKMRIEIEKLFKKDAPAAVSTFKEKLLSFGTKWEDIGQRTATGIHTAFSSLFFDAMKRDMDDLRDYAARFGDVLLKIFSEVAAKAMLVKMWDWTGPFLGVVEPTKPSPKSHRGGQITRTGTKQFHNGGEVNARLLTGEGVLSRTGMMNLGGEKLSKLNQGQSINNNQGQAPIIVIQAWDTQDVMRNIKTITNAIAQNMQSNGTMRRVIQQYG